MSGTIKSAYSVLAMIVVMFMGIGQAYPSSQFGVDSDFQPPTVLVVILARNKAHTLPYYLGYLERLNYPKARMSLWIRSDHNIDMTQGFLELWLSRECKNYHSVNISINETKGYFSDEEGIFHWSREHFDHIIKLREEALEQARKMWADFVWFLDCDVFLTNNNTLEMLMAQGKTVIAPALESLGAYSNFWCGMTEKGYYKRTDEYMPILERQKTGCFEVPMIHSAVLVDLRRSGSRYLTFDPKKSSASGPHDDIITFALSAKSAGVKMYVLNVERFGYILPPPEGDHNLDDDAEQLLNLKMEVLVEHDPLEVSRHLINSVMPVPKDTLGFDQVYLINLRRRPERRIRMERCFDELGIKAKLIEAVDGKQLNDSYLKEMGIRMMPEYSDPYHKRPLTMGEIGCFLSHYTIWNDMLANQHRTAIVFEDDIRFEPSFRRRLDELIADARRIGLHWDLIYLGRKRLSEEAEPYVAGTSRIVHVDYSYWTLCYVLTLEGARKLVEAEPLSKLVPVDEYLPIMFNRHPESTWMEYFSVRNVRAFSAYPLLTHPTHYTGEENYISDTEDSQVIDHDEL